MNHDTELVEVRCGSDEFDNAIRLFGVRAACQWFGHDLDGDFANETVKLLNDRLQERKEKS